MEYGRNVWYEMEDLWCGMEENCWYRIGKIIFHSKPCPGCKSCFLKLNVLTLKFKSWAGQIGHSFAMARHHCSISLKEAVLP